MPENEDLMKTDVVTYGMGAKIYMEKHDAIVKKVWHDGDVTWIAWTQKYDTYVLILVMIYVTVKNHSLIGEIGGIVRF